MGQQHPGHCDRSQQGHRVSGLRGCSCWLSRAVPAALPSGPALLLASAHPLRSTCSLHQPALPCHCSFETARLLAEQGLRTVVAARNEGLGREAVAKLQQGLAGKAGAGSVEFRCADLNF